MELRDRLLHFRFQIPGKEEAADADHQQGHDFQGQFSVRLEKEALKPAPLFNAFFPQTGHDA